MKPVKRNTQLTILKTFADHSLLVAAKKATISGQNTRDPNAAAGLGVLFVKNTSSSAVKNKSSNLDIVSTCSQALCIMVPKVSTLMRFINLFIFISIITMHAMFPYIEALNH